MALVNNPGSTSSEPDITSVVQPIEEDFRPAAAAAGRVLFHEHAQDQNIRMEPLQLEFLLRLADALNTTLDLNTLLHRVADLVQQGMTLEQVKSARPTLDYDGRYGAPTALIEGVYADSSRAAQARR